MGAFMSHFDPGRRNDPNAQIEESASLIWRAIEAASQDDVELDISDKAIATILTAATKLYFAKVEREGRTFRPLLGEKDEHVCASEVITAATELLRAMSLSPMELALWWRRRPEDAGFTPEPGAPTDNSQ